MPRPVQNLYEPADADPDGYVDGGTGAALTLLASEAGDDLAHRLNITSGDDLSLITFTISGTDENGAALEEEVTGPNNTTVETVGYFLTVDGIEPSGTLGANTVDIGWVDEFVTPFIPTRFDLSNISLHVEVDGAIEYTLQHTLSDPEDISAAGAVIWSDSSDTDVVGATTSQDVGYAMPVSGFRLVVGSYTDGASLILQKIEAFT